MPKTHRSIQRGSDFVTVNGVIQLLGPQATMLMEMHERLQVLEAQHGIIPAIQTDTEGLPPNLSGDMD